MRNTNTPHSWLLGVGAALSILLLGGLGCATVSQESLADGSYKTKGTVFLKGELKDLKSSYVRDVANDTDYVAIDQQAQLESDAMEAVTSIVKLVSALVEGASGVYR